jgi:hypothetical protein
MTAGRIPKHDVSAWIEEEDYLILRFAGWNFSKEVREFCHASADIYRHMIGRPILQKILAGQVQE